MRLAIIGVLVLIVAIGGWIALNRDDSSKVVEDNSNTQDVPVKTEESAPETNTDAEQSPESVQSFEISYTSSGFSPSSLTVSVGDTVTFTNNSNGQMWVASNPHPIHTDLSGFDSRKGVSNGETYEFTFNTAGSHSYHNHLGTNNGGTIIVK